MAAPEAPLPDKSAAPCAAPTESGAGETTSPLHVGADDDVRAAACAIAQTVATDFEADATRKLLTTDVPAGTPLVWLHFHTTTDGAVLRVRVPEPDLRASAFLWDQWDVWAPPPEAGDSDEGAAAPEPYMSVYRLPDATAVHALLVFLRNQAADPIDVTRILRPNFMQELYPRGLHGGKPVVTDKLHADPEKHAALAGAAMAATGEPEVPRTLPASGDLSEIGYPLWAARWIASVPLPTLFALAEAGMDLEIETLAYLASARIAALYVALQQRDGGAQPALPEDIPPSFEWGEVCERYGWVLA